MVGGPDRHRGPVTETTLVVWRSLGVSGLHEGGRLGMESVSSSEFLLGMFIFVVVWLSVAVGLGGGYHRSC
jgi:hypothetical protein